MREGAGWGSRTRSANESRSISPSLIRAVEDCGLDRPGLAAGDLHERGGVEPLREEPAPDLRAVVGDVFRAPQRRGPDLDLLAGSASGGYDPGDRGQIALGRNADGAQPHGRRETVMIFEIRVAVEGRP